MWPLSLILLVSTATLVGAQTVINPSGTHVTGRGVPQVVWAVTVKRTRCPTDDAQLVLTAWGQLIVGKLSSMTVKVMTQVPMLPPASEALRVME